MNFDGNIASGLLNRLPTFLDYEVLVSTPGIEEPDSGFMWGSNFRAPVGISVEGEEVSFNLYLPSGSEKDKNLLIFFNRVGAKFQDGLWQVRRNLGELSEVYAGIIKNVISMFPSVILDYSYIEEGRYYAHFLFSSTELESISDALVAFIKVIPGYKVEYLEKLEHPSSAFERVSEIDDVSTAVLEIKPTEAVNSALEGNYFFIMSNYNKEGVKVVGCAVNDGKNRLEIPRVLNAREEMKINSHTTSLKCQNDFMTTFLKLSRQNFLILSSVYGETNGDSTNILITMPTAQVSVFLNTISDLKNEVSDWGVTLKEVSKLRNALAFGVAPEVQGRGTHSPISLKTKQLQKS